jgi:glyoxylase-like metal-dependent hydrolase (beta-lactamase superfamily II)
MRPRELSRSIGLFAARTPTLPPATHTNSYALGARDVLLVEPATPYDDEQRAFVAWARSLEAEGRRAVALVATHHHPDHVGGVAALARALDLPLWAHAETAARVDWPVARRLADGEHLDLDGPVPERWTVLHTPGHAAGHVCLWNEAERTVVAGDMVASVGTILIDPDEGDMAEYLAQLGRLAALDARLALPAHGEPIDEPTALFRRYIAHRTMREGKVLAAVAARGRPSTAEEIVIDAYDDVPAATLPIALISVRAHLAKLERDGRVTVAPGPRYSPAAMARGDEE